MILLLTSASKTTLMSGSRITWCGSPGIPGSTPSVFPIGLFGTGTGKTDAWFTVGNSPDSDQGIISGSDLVIRGPTSEFSALVSIEAYTSVRGSGILVADLNGSIDLTERSDHLRVPTLSSTTGYVSLIAVEADIITNLITGGGDVTVTGLSLDSRGGLITSTDGSIAITTSSIV